MKNLMLLLIATLLTSNLTFTSKAFANDNNTIDNDSMIFAQADDEEEVVLPPTDEEEGSGDEY